MNAWREIRGMLVVVSVSVLITRGQDGTAAPLPPESAPARSLPDPVIKEWTAAGASTVWIQVRDSGFRLSPPRVGATDIPTFHFYFHEKRPIDLPDFSKFSDPETPFGLIINGFSVAASDLKKLAHLKSLVALRLDYCKFERGATKQLTLLDSLRYLSLCGVSHEDLTELVTLKELKMLDVSMSSVTDSEIEAFRKLKELKYLGLESCRQISDRGLEHLAGFGAIRGVTLNHTEITDTGVSALSKIRQLAWLDLGFAKKVTDGGLKELARLENLQYLNLEATKVTDTGLRELASLTNLEDLNLFATDVAGTGLRHLSGMEKLRRLNLSQTKVDNAGLKWAARLKSLQSLNLWGTQVNDSGLAELLALPDLEELTLWDTAVTDEGLKSVSKFGSLRRLDLEDTQVTDAGLKQLAGMRLEYLRIPEGAQTDLGLGNFLAASDSPSGLDLIGWNITDLSVKEIATQKTLKWVILRRTKVTDQGIEQLKTALPKCEVIR